VTTDGEGVRTEGESKSAKVTLTDFIEENQKLLSSIAIFTALSIFVNQLPGELIRSDENLKIGVRMLSCLLCILATLVYLEVVKNSLRYPDHGIMRGFNSALFVTFVVFIFVWARTFILGIVGALLMLFLAVLFMLSLALFAFLIRTTMRHTSLLKSKSQQIRDQYIPMFGALVLMLAALAIIRHFAR
jgi:hypothetical protein